MARPIGSEYSMIEWDAATGQRIQITYRVWAHEIDRKNVAHEQVEEIAREVLPDQFHQSLGPEETKRHAN
jgi:hypothetical protein